MHCNDLPLSYNWEVTKWHESRSMISKIWDMQVLDMGGLITIVNFRAALHISSCLVKVEKRNEHRRALV